MGRSLIELRIKRKNLENKIKNNEWKALKVLVWNEWSEDDPRYTEYLKEREVWRKEHRRIVNEIERIEKGD